MPGFFANIPVLSALPNPLNLFNDDVPSQQDNNTPTTPTPILATESEISTQQHRKTSGTSVVIADDVESDSPRLGRTNGRRPRGLSVTSGVSGADSANGRKAKRRVDTFVIVKPPPTASKPLNLQVQLVVPEKRSRPRGVSDATAADMANSGDLSSAPSTPQRRSMEQLEDPEKTPVPQDVVEKDKTRATTIKRSNSISSSASSGAASANSANSSASGKRIVPLYNLSVHNVMHPTAVTDAGTDSKVAKFGKRQLDIAGVGILEPSEIWLPHAGQAAGSPRPSVDCSRSARSVSMYSTMNNLSPATSRADTSTVSLTATVSSQDDSSKKFFGKLFRKRGSAEPLRTQTLFLPPEKAASLQVPSTPASPVQAPHVHFPADPASLTMVGRPTFGLAPNVLTRRVSLTALDPSGAIVGLASEGALLPNDETVSLLRSAHPVGYSWTVRKWAKRNTEGWAAKVAAAGSDLVSNLLPTDGADDVVFEWVKLRVSPNSNGSEALLKKHMAAEHIGLRRKRRPSNPASLRPSPAGSNTSLGLTRRKTENLLALDGVQQGPPPAKSKLFRRSSISSRPPTAPVINVPVPEVALPSMSEESRSPVSTRESEESAPGGTESVVDDESYDSDPEDSETPWQCSVWVKKTGKRQLIATLTPAPHHPKVIGILRIPMHVRTISLTPKVTNNGVSLPNFANFANNIANLGNNNNNSNGNGNNQNQNDTEIELTEENIKDVISVTAMWLVAREDFGGHSHKGKVKK